MWPVGIEPVPPALAVSSHHLTTAFPGKSPQALLWYQYYKRSSVQPTKVGHGSNLKFSGSHILKSKWKHGKSVLMICYLIHLLELANLWKISQPAQTSLTFDTNCKFRGSPEPASSLRIYSEVTECYYTHRFIAGKGYRLKSAKGRHRGWSSMAFSLVEPRLRPLVIHLWSC